PRWRRPSSTAPGPVATCRTPAAGPSLGRVPSASPRSWTLVAAIRATSAHDPKDLVRQAEPVEDPGEHERLLLPGVVAPALAAVPSTHLGLEQVGAARGHRPQPGDPLGRLVVAHPGVVQTGHREDR